MSRITEAEDGIKAMAWSDLVKAKTLENELRDQIRRLIEAAQEAKEALWHEANVSPMSASTRTRLKSIALKLADDQSGW